MKFKTQPDLQTIYNSLYSHYGPQHWWPGDTPFEIAVGAILTQNTNWTNVEKAIRNLKEREFLSPETMHGMMMDELASLIRPAGYFTVKAKRLKAFISFLMEKHGGSMEEMGKEETQRLRQELLSVHGVGPETADSVLLYALDKPVFVIDVYTRRLLSRHGIMDYKASYNAYQELFHRQLDENIQLFNEYHALIVRVGKDFCKPTPRCRECPLCCP